MAILTLDECLDFLDVSRKYFTVDSANDTLYLKYDSGSSTAVGLTDGTYSGDDLATHMKTQIDAALTCTSTVTFSSTTLKFTWAVGAGHTLTYTHANSDAGLMVGLTQDHAAALSITSDIETGDPTAMITLIRNGVEKCVQNRCRRTFESTSYSLERYDGKGSNWLYLKNYPITALTRLAIGYREAIEVYNTSENTTASVSVSSTGLVLEKDGATDSTLLFATYTTMTLLVAALNVLGSGWYGRVTNSDYESFKSTELLPVYGQNCIDRQSVYLKMPEDAEQDFEVYDNEGMIVNNFSNFARGSKNVIISYTAGYSSATMPEDLKMAVKIAVKDIYQKRIDETFSVQDYGVDGIRVNFETDIPKEAKQIFDMYMRRLV